MYMPKNICIYCTCSCINTQQRERERGRRRMEEEVEKSEKHERLHYQKQFIHTLILTAIQFFNILPIRYEFL